MNETIDKKFMSAVHQQNKSGIASTRLALLSGIVFSLMQIGALLYFVILVFPHMGPPNATAQHVAFYTQQGMTLKLGNYLMTLPTPFFLLFLGGLFGILRRIENGAGVLASAAIISGAIVAILWPLSAALNHMGIDIAQAGGDMATIVALDSIGVLMLALSALPRMVLLVATAVVLLASQQIPRWLAWTALVLGVMSVIGSATLVLAELFPLLALSTLLFELWILALSATLLQNDQLITEN